MCWFQHSPFSFLVRINPGVPRHLRQITLSNFNCQRKTCKLRQLLYVCFLLLKQNNTEQKDLWLGCFPVALCGLVIHTHTYARSSLSEKERKQLGNIAHTDNQQVFYVNSPMLQQERLLCKHFLFFLTSVMSFHRTLSNWVYEFDKWAPSVVKVSYKVNTIYCFPK